MLGSCADPLILMGLKVDTAGGASACPSCNLMIIASSGGGCGRFEE